MIDGELFKMRDAALEKVDFFEVPDEFIIDQTFNGLSFESDHIKREDVVAHFNNEEIDPTKATLISNHRKAFLKAVEMAKENIPLTENNLKDLHQILMDNISNI